MPRFKLVAILAIAVYAAMPVGATSYEPVTFDELVSKADVIFVGDVTDARSFPLDTRDGTGHQHSSQLSRRRSALGHDERGRVV
jgi:hypothetical protein